MNPRTTSKTCCTLLKTFLNNKKIPCISSFYQNNKIVNGFRKKPIFLIIFLTMQSTLVDSPIKPLTESSRKTRKSLSTIPFSEHDIPKIIRNLDPGKPNRHNMIVVAC